MSFWHNKIAPQQLPEPAIRADSEAYRQLQAARSGSRVYSAEYAAARTGSVAPKSIYVEREYSLESYQKAPSASKWARRADESPEAYLQRTGAILRAIESLPETEQKLITETRETILTAEPQSVKAAHDELRTIIDQRQSAQGVQQEGHRVAADERFGTPSRVEKLGGSPMPDSICGARLPSAVEVAANLRQAEADRQAAIPQRVDVSQPRSSGDGLIITNQ